MEIRFGERTNEPVDNKVMICRLFSDGLARSVRIMVGELKIDLYGGLIDVGPHIHKTPTPSIFFQLFFWGLLFLFTIWDGTTEWQNSGHCKILPTPIVTIAWLHAASVNLPDDDLRFLCAPSSVPTGILMEHASAYMRLQEPLGILGLRTLSL